MRYLLHVRQSLTLGLGVVAIAAALNWAGASRADRFPPDPVNELRDVLRAPIDEKEREQSLKKRERLLAERLKALRTIPEMRRALLLQEWRLDQVDLEVSKVDRKYRDELVLHFQDDVRRVLRQGNAVDMLAELGSTIRNPEEARGLGPELRQDVLRRFFQDDVADLVRHGKAASVRATAARTLGQIYPDPDVAVPALRSLLEPSHVAEERRAAAQGLLSLVRVVSLFASGTTSAGKPAALKVDTKSEDIATDVARTGQAVVSAASGGLADADPEVRGTSAEAIYQAAAGLTTSSPHPRDESAEGLLTPEQLRAELNPLMAALKNGVPKLTQALSDPDPRVRVAVLRTLEEMGASRQQFQRAAPDLKPDPKSGDPLLDGLKTALPAVIRALSDPSVTARRKALDVLETLGREASVAVPALVRETTDPDVFVRWAAARVLGEIGPVDTATTIPALVRLLRDDDLDVNLAAARAFDRYGPAAQTAVPALAQAVLKAPDGRMRQAAIAALLGIGTGAREAIPALSAALSDRDLDVRRTAAEALAKFGPAAAQAEPALRQALQQSLVDLEDPNEHVREAAAKVRLAVSDAILSISAKGK
jgi:HEAT repeat protein